MLAVFVADVAPSAFPWISAACFPRRVLQDRPLLGAPTQFPGLAYEPVNEMGVMMLFAMVSRQLGFVIESVQAGFPDCHVKIEVEPGRWQDLRIEFEYESRNFKEHGHDPQKCDLELEQDREVLHQLIRLRSPDHARSPDHPIFLISVINVNQ